ncbi:hypothetical protein MUY27_20200 [Mucilaginibacter sp. RS28]|uniref:Uncharacterized protein n=1 Tax=Mucilaginibacter straminoryzae TaxID=2932774 RepID=A0A9X1X8E3_9SPHI|nr:hypothetical protein [Mucilaginibacter straminoryzae]MCJ8212050.1 hypothetical protein [Mucilaginibacter straminoryzae]
MKKLTLLVVICFLQLTQALGQDLNGSSIAIQQDPGSDQNQSLTPIALTNRGQNGIPYTWKIYTSAVGGGFGVRPNAFEVWEYPPQLIPNLSCCLQRFVIDKTNSAQWSPFIIDSRGGLALGGYANAGSNILSINGNVGIGTTNTQGYALGVNGTIHSQQIKVDMNGWSDYVFRPNYKLPSLQQINVYIDQNHHLPEIPSAKEIEKNGANLGELVKLQMKKIEELTLYLIEKDKKDQKQQQQINYLLKRLKTGKDKLNR